MSEQGGWTGLLVGLVTIIIGAATFWLATRASHEQAKVGTLAVDAAAYTRAAEIYEGTIKTLTDEISRLRTEMKDLRDELMKSRTETGQLLNHITELQATISMLKSPGGGA